jgi:hypothetical protein
MADIINLDSRRAPMNVSNGAREALIGVAQSLPNETGLNDAEAWTDWLLTELWVRGFKVVPVDGAL